MIIASKLRPGESLQSPVGAALHCVACGGPISGDPYFAHGTIRLFACDECRSLTALPRPSVETQIARHDNADYFEHPYFEQRRTARSILERRCRTTFEKIGSAVALEALAGERHLDIGCDTGAFLATAARLYGTIPVGIDIAWRSVQEAARQGIELYCSPIESAPETLRDLALITAIDLIEHVVDPGKLLAQVRARLRPGGVCYFETPNIASSVYRVGRTLARVTGGAPSWVFERLFPSEHIQYFSPAGLRALAAQAGLDIVEISTRPLPHTDIAASVPVRIGMATVQTLDRGAAGEQILLCMLARRPYAQRGSTSR